MATERQILADHRGVGSSMAVKRRPRAARTLTDPVDDLRTAGLLREYAPTVAQSRREAFDLRHAAACREGCWTEPVPMPGADGALDDAEVLRPSFG